MPVRAGWITVDGDPEGLVSVHLEPQPESRPTDGRPGAHPCAHGGTVNPTAPIPPEGVRAADELRALLRSGALPRLGLVDVGGGSRLAFELAIRATLNDLDRLTARERGGQVVGGSVLAVEAQDQPAPALHRPEDAVERGQQGSPGRPFSSDAPVPSAHRCARWR